jgi:IS5 family transposase
LAKTLFDELAARLAERGWLLRQGTLVDATLIAAPPSTKNRERRRDEEMSSTKKGNNDHFGMKAHIGVDADSGLVHTEPVWAFAYKRKKGEELTSEQEALNRMLASLRAKVEHPFRIVKRQFGYAKTRYRGLFKNAQQLSCCSRWPMSTKSGGR